MAISSYFYEISDSIENNNDEPENILKNLYDKHLKSMRDNASHSGVKNKLQMFYRRTSKQPKIKILDNIIDLYNETFTTDSQKKQIISILSAYTSFFPKEMRNIPAEIKSQLNILKASDILSNLVNESLLSKMTDLEKANGLDYLLCALPDKGNNIIQAELQKIKNFSNDNYQASRAIQFLSLIPEAIAAQPFALQHEIIVHLVEILEITCLASYGLRALANLSPILTTIPIMREFMYQKLHMILRSCNHDFYWTDAAYCLAQLSVNSTLYNALVNKKTIDFYIDYIKKNAHGHLYGILRALIHLEKPVEWCDKTTAKEMILTLCARLNSLNGGENKIRILQILGQFSPIIINLPEDVINTVLTSLINNLPSIEELILEDDQNLALSHISKLKGILEKYPNYAEKTLSVIFNQLMTSKEYNITLSQLFLSWHSLLDPIKKRELFYKLYQHFVNSKPWNWISPATLSSLLKCFEDLPNEASVLVDFFKSILDNKDSKNIPYAIKALGGLHFSLIEQPEKSLSVLTRLKNILSEHTQYPESKEYEDCELMSALFAAFSNMSKLLAVMQPELIKLIIMDLWVLKTHRFAWYNRQDVKTILQLQKYLDHALLTSEDKQKITEIALTFTGRSIETADILCLFNKNIKQTINGAFLNHNHHTSLESLYANEFSQMLVRIILNFEKNHTKHLSWVCQLKNYMRVFSDENTVYQKALANAIGILLSHTKRQELVLEKLPKELAACVEDYTDSEAAVLINKKYV